MVTVLVPREEWEMGVVHTTCRHKSPIILDADIARYREMRQVAGRGPRLRFRSCMRQERGFNANESYREAFSRRNITKGKGIHVAAELK